MRNSTTPVSSGTVFTKLRDNALQGTLSNTGWAEWSVEEMKNPKEKKWWYETNPSLGIILSERKILDEVGTDDIDFNIQRLGYWVRYSLKSANSEQTWNALKVDSLPKLKGKLYVGIKYGPDNTNVAMSIACKISDDKIFVECIDCQPVRNGTGWIIRFLQNAQVQNVVVDGVNGQQLLQDALKDYGLKSAIMPTVKEVISAYATFTLGLDQDKIRKYFIYV